MSLNADASIGYVEALPEVPEPRPVFDSKRVPGNPAIWVGIFSELTEFALFFVVYFIARSHYPEEFSSGPAKLHTLEGTANTLVLITSSYFVARGIVALRADQPVKAVRWLSATVACGVIYLLIKCGEYLWNQQHGIHTNSSNFFAVYYYTTFNHMLHIFWGSGGIIWAIFGIRSGKPELISDEYRSNQQKSQSRRRQQAVDTKPGQGGPTKPPVTSLQ